MRAVPCRIALLGLGNLMRTDDAVGMLTLRETRRVRPACRLKSGSSKEGHLGSICSTAFAASRTSWRSMQWIPALCRER